MANKPESTGIRASIRPSIYGLDRSESAQICSDLLWSARTPSNPLRSSSILLESSRNWPQSRLKFGSISRSPLDLFSLFCLSPLRQIVVCLNLPVRFDPLIRPPETCKRRLAARRTFHHWLSIAIHCFIAPPHLCLCSYGSTDLHRLAATSAVWPLVT